MTKKGPDSGKALIDALIKGGEKSYKEFFHLSGSCWLQVAPEYFLTVHAALALRDFDRTFALLEVSVDESRAEAGATRAGPAAKDERRNGRYDIVVYWADEFPRGAIEVKSSISSVDRARLEPDFVRLCKTLSANAASTFQFAAFLFYASVSEPKENSKQNSASQKLRELIERTDDLAKETATKQGVRRTLVTGAIHRGTEDDGAWCVSCIVFTKAGAEQSFR